MGRTAFDLRAESGQHPTETSDTRLQAAGLAYLIEHHLLFTSRALQLILPSPYPVEEGCRQP
uniref:Uncharacterized protein n=1 Tax=Picea glauca TaxID=3330 RepID=A0A101M529_PICGL|nr:hypothetical protein ABT39_MTgene1088 [Picea glauca]